MQLIRFGDVGAEKPGVLHAGTRRDCSGWFRDWDRDFFMSGGMDALRGRLQGQLTSLPEVPASARWGACIGRPGKVVCIGLNYADHARESGAAVPAEPVVFLKATNAMVGPFDPIVIPRGSRSTDWEVELGIVIGRPARYLATVADAPAHIAGFCISHDVSEREFQKEHGGQWTKGKSCDTFNPVGPMLVTSDTFTDPGRRSLTTDVNGERMQSGNTANMIFDPAYLVWYLSQFMTLEAGDLISSGTPAGVGMGRNPPRYLRPGDIVELAIDGLGAQRSVCIASDAGAQG